MGFQSVVNTNPAPAVEGDFASINPRAIVLAGPAALVTGPNGVTVGKFAWVEPGGVIANNYGSAPNVPDGFVHRDQQALITDFLGQASNVVPEGFPITLFSAGDFWARNLGPGVISKGTPIYAGYADGGLYTAAPTGASVTATLGSTNTASLGSTSTGTAVVGESTQITLSGVTGLVSIGDTLSGTGITAGTTVVSQVSGTTGGAGVYQLSTTNTAAAATITSFGNIVNVTVVSTYISVGDTISGGAGFPVAATIAAQVSGTAGGVGVYQLSAPGTAYTASAAGVTTFGITLTVTVVGSGALLVGQPVTDTTTAANVATGAAVAAQLSGTPGGLGIYQLNLSSAGGGGVYAAGNTVTAAGGVLLTGWAAVPTSPGDGAVGALVKISSWPVA